MIRFTLTGASGIFVMSSHKHSRAGAVEGTVSEETLALPQEAVPQWELSGKLAGLSLPRQVFVLAIWPLAEQFLNFLVGTVDLALAARLTPETLAVAATDALGVAGYIGWLLGMLHASVGVGASALVARAIGGRHKRLANAALGQALLLGALAGAVLGAVVFAGAPVIASLAGLSGEALALCTTYLRVIASVAPLSAILFVGAACLRGAGDTQTPFWVMVAVNGINAIASILFVFGPAPIGGYGVTGIAAGTAVAWTVGAAIIIFTLLRGKGGVRLRWMRLRPHWHTARRIIAVGLPNLFESSGMWVGNFLVLTIVGRLPTQGTVGAHMIAIRLESVSFLMGMAVGVAGATLAGQYLGAGQPKRAKQAVGLCWAAGVGLMMVMGLLFLLLPGLLVRIISDVPLHLELVPPVLRLAGWIQLFFASYIVLSTALRGAGDTSVAMRITYASTFLIRLPAAYILAVPMGMGFYGLWIALCGELVIRGTAFAIRFIHGGWTRIEV